MTDTGRAPRLTGLTLADPPELWRSLGFTVTDHCCVVGGVAMDLVGNDDGRSGIVGWSFDRDVGPLAGPRVAVAPPPLVVGSHANGIVAVDHVVLTTDDVDATRDALAAGGIPLRREWSRRVGSHELTYLFAVVGPTVLECVGGMGGTAGLWGITLVADELDAAAVRLGADPGLVRDAVQPGRRILTLDTRARGGSVRLAVMSPRAPGGG